MNDDHDVEMSILRQERDEAREKLFNVQESALKLLEHFGEVLFCEKCGLYVHPANSMVNSKDGEYYHEEPCAHKLTWRDANAMQKNIDNLMLTIDAAILYANLPVIRRFQKIIEEMKDIEFIVSSDPEGNEFRKLSEFEYSQDGKTIYIWPTDNFVDYEE